VERKKKKNLGMVGGSEQRGNTKKNKNKRALAIQLEVAAAAGG